MTERMSFTVPGPPVAKQRPRRAPAGHWYTPQRTKDYEDQVAWEAKAAGVVLEAGKRYRIRLDIYLSTHRRDLDNIAKSLLDGLNKLGEWDDSQVADLHLVPHSVRDASEEKVEVTVE